MKMAAFLLGGLNHNKGRGEKKGCLWRKNEDGFPVLNSGFGPEGYTVVALGQGNVSDLI